MNAAAEGTIKNQTKCVRDGSSPQPCYNTADEGDTDTAAGRNEL